MSGEALAEFLSDPDCYLLLAVEAGRVVGSLNVRTCFMKSCADGRRNLGIGKALVQRFIDEARAVGASEVWVLTNESNSSAMAMYERCGLRREKRDDVMLSIMLNVTPRKL